jgi:hypothetical protein
MADGHGEWSWLSSAISHQPLAGGPVADLAKPPPDVASRFAGALAAAVDGYLAGATRTSAATRGADCAACGLIPPRRRIKILLRDRRPDVARLVGPSHFVGFDGVAVHGAGVWTPFGVAAVDQACVDALVAATPIVRASRSRRTPASTAEMQPPFQHPRPPRRSPS